MRIILNDHAGYAFPLELSRELAARGHQVLVLHCGSVQAPKGPVQPRPDDPPTLEIRALDLGEPFEKYDAARRLRHEVRLGRLVAAAARSFEPDVVVSNNVPLLTMAATALWAARSRVPWVFWLQDVQSIAIREQAAERLGVAGQPAGATFEGLERLLARRADRVIAITPDFLPVLDGWGVRRERTEVIENWAPLDELPPLPRDNEWSRRMGLDGRRVVLYAGTLGLKHNPGLLLELARSVEDRGDTVVVVASEGPGADWLRAEGGDQPNLQVHDYQPFEDVPAMLASADVLVAILEPGAATFSVPSKVLSYFCVGRPVLAAIPPGNQAARLIERVGAGAVVTPDDPAAFVDAARRLLDDPTAAAECGARARAHAVDAFAIGPLADRFEQLLEPLVGPATR